MDKVQETVNEILKLGTQKKEAYARLDELETELRAESTLASAFRGMFPNSSSSARREELDNTVRTIELLRMRMDELRDSIPLDRFFEAFKDIEHLWSYENTTSLSQLREHPVRQQPSKSHRYHRYIVLPCIPNPFSFVEVTEDNVRWKDGLNERFNLPVGSVRARHDPQGWFWGQLLGAGDVVVTEVTEYRVTHVLRGRALRERITRQRNVRERA